MSFVPEAARRPLAAILGAPAAALLACLTAGPATAAGGLLPPVPVTEIDRGFEAPRHRYAPGHRGVDLPAAEGAFVLSASTGTVTVAGPVAGRSVVVVRSGNLLLTYEPVDPSVSVGQRVSAGTPLGRLAAAGSHCAPSSCLHWGVRSSGSYLDPMALLSDREVRLLPLWRSPTVSPTAHATSAAARPSPVPSERPAASASAPAPPPPEETNAGTAPAGGVPLALPAAALTGVAAAGIALSRPVR